MNQKISARQVSDASEETKQNTSLIYLLFLLFGVYALSALFGGLTGVAFTGYKVYPWILAFGVVLWVGYAYFRRFFPLFLAGELLVCGVFAWVCSPALASQTVVFFNCLSGEVIGSVTDISVLMAVLGMLLSILYFLLELALKNHWILYVLTTALLLLSPLIRVHMTVLDLAMLFLFQICFFGLHRGGRGRKWVPMLVTASGVFVAAVVVAAWGQDLFFDAAYQAEGTMVRNVSERTGMASQPVSGGQISSGNNYLTGAEQVLCEVSQKPTEDLYLRGFGGGEYIGGDWIRSSDEELFAQILERTDWEIDAGDFATLYYQMYYSMNEISKQEESPEAFGLRLTRTDGRTANQYVPYYSRRSSYWWSQEDNTWKQDDYAFHYFEQKDMDIKWDDTEENYKWVTRVIQFVEESYMDEIQEAYTQVPEEMLPRLTQLVEENPLTDQDEITSFILYTLNSHCTYSLTPGWAPVNEDIVEYFLFDSGEGYCEHFAVTATLMYRLYGIPARYATGYLVPASQFTKEDGVWTARLTDENAHAWVEIFLPDYGWTPVEVTPSESGNLGTSYPGFDGSTYDAILSEHQWTTDPVLLFTQSGTSGGASTLAADADWEFLPEVELDTGKNTLRDVLVMLAVILIYVLMFIPIVLDNRRKHLQKERETEAVRRTYHRLFEMLHYGGFLLDHKGDEAGVSVALNEEIRSVSLKEWQQFISIVSRAAYGPEGDLVSDAERKFIQEIYARTAREVKDHLGWMQKQTFTYIKVFDGLEEGKEQGA